jgi:hypothetical protein
LSLTGAIFVLAFCAGCVLAFSRHPMWGAVTYVATFYLSPQLRWWGQGVLGDIRWSYIAAIATAAALIITKRAKSPTIPLTRHWVFWALLLFVGWLALQSLWALDPVEHADLLTYYVKFVVAVILIYRCVDSEESLRLFLWANVCGCFYFGWIAFTSYEGGRFEDFGGAGINEANAGALTLVTGTYAAASLFLAGRLRSKIALLAMVAVILNAIAATVSRSGFLALAAGGIAYNWFTRRELSNVVRGFSVLAVVLFLLLTGPSYWMRMQSLEHAGENVEGVDTGEDRLAIIQAQWRMFLRYPMGCGATCTVVLSQQYIEERYLTHTAQGELRRASHNTFMTMLVEHGIPGAVFYLALVSWTYTALRRLARGYGPKSGPMATLFPAIAAIMAAITIADMFVTYAKFELRMWYIAVLMAMLSLLAEQRAQVQTARKEATARAPYATSAPVGSGAVLKRGAAAQTMSSSGPG